MPRSFFKISPSQLQAQRMARRAPETKEERLVFLYCFLFTFVISFIFWLCKAPENIGSVDEIGESSQTPSQQPGQLALSSLPTDTNTEVGVETTRDIIMKRILQGVILAMHDDNDHDEGASGNAFAYFGTGDPIPVLLCSICLVNFEQGDRIVSSSCKHVFHKNCLLEWVSWNKTCPCCMKSFADPEAAIVQPVLALD